MEDSITIEKEEVKEQNKLVNILNNDKGFDLTDLIVNEDILSKFSGLSIKEEKEEDDELLKNKNFIDEHEKLSINLIKSINIHIANKSNLKYLEDFYKQYNKLNIEFYLEQIKILIQGFRWALIELKENDNDLKLLSDDKKYKSIFQKYFKEALKKINDIIFDIEKEKESEKKYEESQFIENIKNLCKSIAEYLIFIVNYKNEYSIKSLFEILMHDLKNNKKIICVIYMIRDVLYVYYLVKTGNKNFKNLKI